MVVAGVVAEVVAEVVAVAAEVDLATRRCRRSMVILSLRLFHIVRPALSSRSRPSWSATADPRDYSRRGAPQQPNARGYRHAGKGRGSRVDYELDYSDSDYYSRHSTPVQGTSPAPGSSRGIYHQRGRGRWGIAGPDLDMLGTKDRVRKHHLESKLRYGNASLSQLLYEDRPFLKPITFVRSQFAPTLFLREEEIFGAVVEQAGL